MLHPVSVSSNRSKESLETCFPWIVRPFLVLIAFEVDRLWWIIRRNFPAQNVAPEDRFGCAVLPFLFTTVNAWHVYEYEEIVAFAVHKERVRSVVNEREDFIRWDLPPKPP